MENQDLALPIDNGEKTRKRKLLTDPERIWTKCRVCQEMGNLESMIYRKVAFKDSEGKELFGCFEGVYFCSANCQGLFKGF